MNRTWLQAGVLALSFLLLSGCGKEAEVPEPPALGTPVEVQTVSLGTISTENKVSGTVISDQSQQVYVALSARCSNVYVAAGDSVKAGQTLCTLDLTSFHDNYKMAELNHQNAQKNYEDQSTLLEQQIAQLEKNYADTLALFEIGAASQLEVDTAKLNLDSANTNRSNALGQLDLAIKNAENNMKQISDSLKNINADGSVPAPISGTIVSISVGRDSFVSAGMPVAVIESNVARKISLAVSENLIAKLHVGDSAQVTISALGQTFESSIVDIAEAVDPANRLYTVQLSVPGEAEGLLSGMFADVKLYTDNRTNTVVIPTEALLVQAEGQYVVLLDENQNARRALVETGLIGDGVTEVTNGLYGGETLVTVGQSYLKDGDPARIVATQE